MRVSGACFLLDLLNTAFEILHLNHTIQCFSALGLLSFSMPIGECTRSTKSCQQSHGTQVWLRCLIVWILQLLMAIHQGQTLHSWLDWDACHYFPIIITSWMYVIGSIRLVSCFFVHYLSGLGFFVENLFRCRHLSLCIDVGNGLGLYCSSAPMNTQVIWEVVRRRLAFTKGWWPSLRHINLTTIEINSNQKLACWPELLSWSVGVQSYEIKIRQKLPKSTKK